jgi:hypothetical protein
LTTFISTLPPIDESNPAWIRFSTPEADGTITSFELKDGGRLPNRERAVRRVIVTWTVAGSEKEPVIYHIDEARFNAGQFPREFLEANDEIDRQQAETFFRNLPRSRAYNADHIRYLKTRLRTNAFRCQQAASRVTSSPPGKAALSYRSDVWICDQVPFGVLRFETLVSNPATGQTVEYRRFDVSNASWYYETSPSK